MAGNCKPWVTGVDDGESLKGRRPWVFIIEDNASSDDISEYVLFSSLLTIMHDNVLYYCLSFLKL